MNRILKYKFKIIAFIFLLGFIYYSDSYFKSEQYKKEATLSLMLQWKTDINYTEKQIGRPIQDINEVQNDPSMFKLRIVSDNNNLDGFGNQFKFDIKNREIISAGEDGIWGTGDEAVLPFDGTGSFPVLRR